MTFSQAIVRLAGIFLLILLCTTVTGLVYTGSTDVAHWPEKVKGVVIVIPIMITMFCTMAIFM